MSMMLSGERPTLQALRAGEVVDLEGIRVRMDRGELGPGDLYVAERNTGPKLLTVRKIDPRGWIEARDSDAYSYNWGECVKVCEA